MPMLSLPMLRPNASSEPVVTFSSARCANAARGTANPDRTNRVANTATVRRPQELNLVTNASPLRIGGYAV
jgi:hypothetical protein